ncbi:MAG TPA: biotin/lipoyl-binding protein, partial [Phycisphaerae bacterium]|nr:biotin/lipoyl-binding protein [Phycisphaerae bacterium]
MKPLSLLCVSTLLLAACSKPAAPEAATKPAQAPVSVELAPVQAMELQRSVRVTGSLVGLETATLSNRVAGRITKIYADRGDRVKPGEKLLEIEPVRFRMGVDESRAALEQVLARLGLKEVPPENFDVNQTAPVKKAKAEYDIAKEKMDRSTPLNKTGAMNDLEYLDIVATARTAESTLENSRDEARALLA